MKTLLTYAIVVLAILTGWLEVRPHIAGDRGAPMEGLAP